MTRSRFLPVPSNVPALVRPRLAGPPGSIRDLVRYLAARPAVTVAGRPGRWRYDGADTRRLTFAGPGGAALAVPRRLPDLTFRPDGFVVRAGPDVRYVDPLPAYPGWPAPLRIDATAARDHWAAGLTDPQVAARLGCHESTIKDFRRLLGLPARRADVAAQAATRAANHSRKRAALASRYGLPADLPPAQVMVLVALTAGPLTAAELADRCGRGDSAGYRKAYHRFQCVSAPGGNHLAALRRRGLVALVPGVRGKGGGSGRGESYFLLTAAAMGMLAAARKDADDPDR